MTVRELLGQAIGDLRQAHIHYPALDAQVLLAHVLGQSRTVLLAALDDRVSAASQREYRELVRRRIYREPVAYLLGTREFWGRTFRVTQAVLIPRPETELLLERALVISGLNGVAVDVGTGSGCLALSFALERPGWEVYATDTSADALAVARQNMELFGIGERVHVLRGSLLEPVSQPVDLVMANLPYVPAGDIPDLEPEVRVWEPRVALDGGSDGLDPVRGVLAQLPEQILPGGACLLELDPRQFDALDHIVATCMPDWEVVRHRDLTGRDRVAELRQFTPS